MSNATEGMSGVGQWRYCPACAQALLPAESDSEDPDHPAFHWEDPRCSGCERLWIACACALNR
jgi:hypothetical protein